MVRAKSQSVKRVPKAPAEPKPEAPQGKYHEGVGRRKTAIARVRIFEDSSQTGFGVNGRNLAEYFQQKECETIATEIMQKISLPVRFGVSAFVAGGGKQAQAEAIRHGIARALIEFDPGLRSQLKVFGYLTRDPRKKERKKFGLKAARRARQWRKR
ncbi:MAG: 30S ribosomal protein S9 [Candidatus Wildermuthbacteria bacterium]|nr:30S ribosomal protein S9 [Candidatus Wildermuthbacteria bacterium]